MCNELYENGDREAFNTVVDSAMHVDDLVENLTVTYQELATFKALNEKDGWNLSDVVASMKNAKVVFGAGISGPGGPSVRELAVFSAMRRQFIKQLGCGSKSRERDLESDSSMGCYWDMQKGSQLELVENSTGS